MRLSFEKQDLQGIHFFTEGLNFPVATVSYSEWETNQINYLESNFQKVGFTTESLCQWCINHQIQYRIIYPIKNISIIRNPYKFYKYLQLKRNLKEHSL